MKWILTAVLVVGACAALGVFANGSSASDEGGTPGVVMLDSLVDKYEAVRFDHMTHTYIAQGCSDCHHQHGSKTDIACTGCHSIESDIFKRTVVHSFLPCRSCHSEPNPDMPALVSLKVAYHQQCFGCHRGMGNVGKGPEGCTEQCHRSKE